MNEAMNVCPQDLVRSLTITNTVKPLRSRFRGQGHVNCLNTGAGAEQQQDWRYSTRGLASLCSVAAASLATILRTSQPRDTGLSDNKMKVCYNWQNETALSFSSPT